MEEEDAFLEPLEHSNGQEILGELSALGPLLPPPERADELNVWERAQQLLQSDEIVELRANAYNKGGLLVAWKGIQGFVPASQLVEFPHTILERERMQALANWNGRVLRLKAIEVDPASSRLIFSERASLVRAVDRENLLRSIKPGDHVSGQVSNLTDFGAFVDLGGVEGLVHISEISWRRLNRPSDALQLGQSLELLVLNVDPASGKVGLSSKKMRPDPWTNADLRYKPNQLVRGIVNKIAAFGVFVALEDELDGLVHITEMAEGSFLHPRDVVRKGEILVARVMHVDPRRMRIALTLRGVNGPVDPGA